MISMVLVDWGTSSFRLWAIDGADGKVIAQTRSDCGMSTLRPQDFEQTLENELAALGVPTGVPVTICGMAGAAQGWVEAPYVPVPASVTQLSSGTISVPSNKRPIRIIPGVSQDPINQPDVMRGEETLLLGLSLLHCDSGLACLPGTHSKWAKIKDGVITEFSTSMTGELFGLLSTQSTLSHFLVSAQQCEEVGSAFKAAVRESLEAPEKVLQTLFSVRSIPLLQGGGAAPNMKARLSGLLIGLEIAGQPFARSESIALVSDGPLAQSYCTAFELAELQFSVLSSEDLVRAGLRRLATETGMIMAKAI